MKYRGKWHKLIALTISTLFAAAICEVLLRLTNYRPGVMDPAMYVANQNPLLPYRLQSNYQGYCGGSQVTTDDEGNRRVSPDYAALGYGADNPQRRILILGDSGVFGFGLSDQDTIASQLQTVCAQRNLRY